MKIFKRRSSKLFIILAIIVVGLITLVTLSGGGKDAVPQSASVISSLPANDMISYWKFDETKGTVASDSSGNGLNGKIVGATSTIGKYNNALSFNGSDNYVSLAGNSTFDNMGAMTISAWIKPSSLGENGKGRIVTKAAGGSLPSYGWSFYLTNEVANGIKFAVDHTTAHLEHASVANAITLNQWQLVTVTWDGSKNASNAHIYVNGNEVSYAVADNAVGTRASDTSNSLYIGSNPARTRSFNGSIDDVKIFNRVLSADEVKNIYDNNSATTTPITPPVASDTTAPSVPTNLQVIPVSTSQINLSWTASTDNTAVTGYNIYRNGTKVISTTATSYSDTSLAAGTTYSYTVSAYDAAGNVCTQTASVSAKTNLASDTTAPSVSTNLKATPVSTSQINLSWTASTDNTAVTGYNIYRGGTKIATANKTSYSNTSLTANTSYSYTVSAYDAAGNISAQTAAVSATTNVAVVADTTAPSVPTNLQTSVISSSQINLSWTASTDDTAVTGYNIYRNGIEITTTSLVAYSDTGLTAGTAYSYTISAYDAAGNTSTQATAVSATTSQNQVSTWWKPTIGTPWQIQLQGTIDQTVNATIFDFDLFDNDASVIASLHAKGKKVICYFSAGSYENWRSDASKFTSAVKGKSNGWAGENWIDIRNLTVLGPIMTARLDLAKQKGCDGVDPDNMDAYTNNTGFTLTAADQLTYNKFIADAAHTRGLGVGLKNDLEQVSDLVSVYDWQINEQCFYYNECNYLTPFINAGKPVFQIEYDLTTSQFCPQAIAMNFDSLKKNMSLDAPRTSCR